MPDAPTMKRMGSNKKPQDDKKASSEKSDDRHKPSRMFRVPMAMAKLLDELGEEEIGSSATEQLKNAVREYLQRKGKLKPKE